MADKEDIKNTELEKGATSPNERPAKHVNRVRWRKIGSSVVEPEEQGEIQEVSKEEQPAEAKEDGRQRIDSVQKTYVPSQHDSRLEAARQRREARRRADETLILNKRKHARRNRIITLLATAIVILLAVVGVRYFFGTTQEQRTLRTAQELKIDIPGKWYSLPKYGIDCQLPSDMEDITPEGLSDFMVCVASYGYDDEICAEAGFITVPDVVEGNFDIEDGSQAMWEQLHPALTRVVQETYNGLLQSVAFDVSWEEDTTFGQYFNANAEYEIQQFTKNKETGAVEPLEQTVSLRAKCAVRNLNGRPVLVWAAYRPGYELEEEEVRDQRFSTVFQSVVAVGDVTGENLGFDYEGVDTLITDDAGDPIRALQEQAEPDENVGEVTAENATTLEKAMAWLGYMHTGDGTWVNDPRRVIFTGGTGDADTDGNGQIDPDELTGERNTIDDEEALRMYKENKEYITENELNSGMDAIQQWKAEQVNYPDNINPNTNLEWGIDPETYEGEIPLAYENGEPVYQSDIEEHAHEGEQETPQLVFDTDE